MLRMPPLKQVRTTQSRAAHWVARIRTGGKRGRGPYASSLGYFLAVFDFYSLKMAFRGAKGPILENGAKSEKDSERVGVLPVLLVGLPPSHS